MSFYFQKPKRNASLVPNFSKFSLEIIFDEPVMRWVLFSIKWGFTLKILAHHSSTVTPNAKWWWNTRLCMRNVHTHGEINHLPLTPISTKIRRRGPKKKPLWQHMDSLPYQQYLNSQIQSSLIKKPREQSVTQNINSQQKSKETRRTNLIYA